MPESLFLPTRKQKMTSVWLRLYEEQPLVRDASRQQMHARKEAPVLRPLQPLGHPQLLQKKRRWNEGSAAQRCPWSALCRPRWSSASSRTGTRGGPRWEEVLGYMCVGVPFEVRSCGSLSLAISPQLKVAPFTRSIPVLHGLHVISAIYSLALMHVHCSCKTKGSHSHWTRAFAFDKTAKAISGMPRFLLLWELSFHLILYLGLCP